MQSRIVETIVETPHGGRNGLAAAGLLRQRITVAGMLHKRIVESICVTGQVRWLLHRHDDVRAPRLAFTSAEFVVRVLHDHAADAYSLTRSPLTAHSTARMAATKDLQDTAKALSRPTYRPADEDLQEAADVRTACQRGTCTCATMAADVAAIKQDLGELKTTTEKGFAQQEALFGARFDEQDARFGARFDALEQMLRSLGATLPSQGRPVCLPRCANH
jgi:hypothetical protein